MKSISFAGIAFAAVFVIALPMLSGCGEEPPETPTEEVERRRKELNEREAARVAELETTRTKLEAEVVALRDQLVAKDNEISTLRIERHKAQEGEHQSTLLAWVGGFVALFVGFAIGALAGVLTTRDARNQKAESR